MSQQIYKFIKFLEQKEGRTPPIESIIKYEPIEKLTEPVQLTLVKQKAYLIKNILERGIEPSKDVQLAAVEQYGNTIKFILERGIEPSKDVQLAAVKQYGWLIKDILESGIEPYPEVKKEAYESLMRIFGEIPDEYKIYFD